MKERTRGILYTTVAFSAWGVLPLYWKALGSVTALEILAHRILWSFAFIAVVLLIQRKPLLFKYLKDVRTRQKLLLMSGLIGLNWFIYVFAVNSGRIVEASLGYYINPILSVILGVIILKERMNALQVIAFILACSGVLYLTLDYGKFPWVAVVLACAFALYGLLKKTTEIDAMPGLLIETMILSPIALAIIVYQTLIGKGALTSLSPRTGLLIVCAGVVTTLPLYWFAQGARRIRLSSVGFLQYIAPTLMLLLGVFLYREIFSTAHQISFGLVWSGLLLYTWSVLRDSRP
ncbi:MAG: EamA family transporter RarD [candidate division WOR-3 bacterium]|nr:MAG: EamA family transporter RarD [candidate division WOR-3 bacterium]